MKIERVELEEEKKISKKTTENKPNKIDNFLIYLAIAGFILPLGFLLSIYVLIRVGNRKVSGNVQAAKIISWIQIGFTIFVLIIISIFPDIFKILVQ